MATGAAYTSRHFELHRSRFALCACALTSGNALSPFEFELNKPIAHSGAKFRFGPAAAAMTWALGAKASRRPQGPFPQIGVYTVYAGGGGSD